MKLSNKFISATKGYCEFSEHVSAPYIRKSFDIKEAPKNAEITICGLGFYILYINGEDITKGHLAPYISAPNDMVYYDNYDITDYLVEDENVVGIILGNGMQNAMGGDIWDFHKAVWRSAPKMAIAIEIDDMLIEADDTFVTHPSPITFDDLRAGEHYDAKLEMQGWNMPNVRLKGWVKAIEVPAPKGEPSLCHAEPIVATYTIAPKNIIRNERGFVYDFGENAAGITMLRIEGRRGQKVTITHGEVLKGDSLSIKNISFGERTREGYMQSIEYTLSGEGEEVFMPHFTYFGFRYAEVIGITEKQATNALLTYVVMNSDLTRIGGFDCSCNTLNLIQDAVIRSDLANFYYFPTDCPHREKNGWTGDANLSCEQMLLNFDATASFEEWLVNIRKAQREDGALPGIVPTGGWGFDWGNGPAWDISIINIPYMIYKFNGDIAVLQDNSEAIYKYLLYIKSKIREDGLLSYGLCDWCQPQREIYTPNKAAAPVEVTDTLVCIEIANKAKTIFEIINHKKYLELAIELANTLRENFRRECIGDDKVVKGYSMTGQAYAIALDIFDESEKKEAFSILLDIVKNSNDHIATGLIGMKVIFEVLSLYGEYNLAYKLVAQTTAPSFGYLIANGFNSLPEDLWEIVYADDGTICYKIEKDWGVSSLNHHFFGVVSAWFFKYVAGLNINPTAKDTSEVIISPCFIEKLRFARAYHDMREGRLDVSWRRVKDTIELTVFIPSNTKISLALQEGYEADKKLKAGYNKLVIRRQNDIR